MISKRALNLLVALVLMAMSSGCGSAFGSLGGSENATRDLKAQEGSKGGAGGQPSAAVGSNRSKGNAGCARLVGNTVSYSEDCPTLEDSGSLESISQGSWVWITDNGEAGQVPGDAPTGNWTWVSSLGELSTAPAEGVAIGGWYWVTANGEVGVAAIDPPAGGGWFWLVSPSQVTATEVPGSFWVPIPGQPSVPGSVGGGWYFAPAAGSGRAGPVYGGSSAWPVLAAPTVATAEKSEELEGVPTIDDLSRSAECGKTHSRQTRCTVTREFVYLGRANEKPGVGYTILGLSPAVEDLNDEASIELDVAADGVSPPTVTKIRGITGGESFEGLAVSGVALPSECPGGGVRIVATIRLKGEPKTASWNELLIMCGLVLSAEIPGA